MADWKMPVSYNFNPSYHAYAYGLMYPQVSEHGQPNLSWTEAAYTHSGGVTATYYSAQTAQQSPTWSPENGSASSYGQCPSHAQNGRLFLSYNKTEPDPKAKDAEQAGSDAPSDSEAHTPDSWSSGSSREGAALTNLNIPSWGDRDYETDRGSPDSGEQISSSVSAAKEEPVSLNLGLEALPSLPALTTSPARPPTQTRKTRAAFSEEQMNALIHRFNIQRYLTPAEMKTLAGATGLTYKQVKTWFQNRRMKLKRHQRDSSWMTERYVVNAVPSTPAPHSQFQTETPRATQDPYSNPQVRESVFKRSPPQTPFYPSYPQSRSPPQATTRPPGNWPLPPAVTHYEFPNPANYMQARDSSDAVNKEGSPTQMPSMLGAAQWTTKEMTLL
ncbi:homeobox protein SAX-1-like isoform X1 [Sinocyclocheilus grahami]|uniref:homeobox protein SAX-1-like isoform X1 n=1 Tax=Sinocyclocheilus grahami TaxID=75366 RepID=UPI0007AD09C8|nr:PREDICTED: homeobox protein SAX-1-like isoform X1 [Sinocyclocheilus grahami]